jgi:hypothetical protein
MSLEASLASQPSDTERELRRALNTALRDLAKTKAKTEDLVAATYQAVRDALVAETAHPVAPPKHKDAKGHEEVGLWHLTDWQGFKRTATYDADVMRRRVHEFIDKSERITDIQRADHPVRDGIVLFGGDMGEGLFNYPTQAFEVDASIFGQWVGVSRLLAESVQRALGIYDEVWVFDEDGNHGRIGSKRDGVPKSDNLDRMAYATARLMVGEQPRLHWPEPSAEDIKRVEVGNYRALLMHGDETGRNGFTSPATFLQYLNKLKAGGYGWTFRDVYTGHRHTHMEMGLADGNGAWYQTGSTESDNRYARDSLGSAAVPSQRLHFIDPDKGRVTAQYKIHLD